MKHGSTRDRLLATGLRVMHAQGFNATGVQDITQAAGVPKGSFYNHFDSKEGFGAEVLGRFWEDRTARALNVLSDESLTPLARLKAYFAAKARAEPTKTFDRGCMIGNFSAEMAGQSRLVRDRLGAVYAAWTRLLAACIAEAQAAGEIRNPGDPETLAAFLIDAFEGAVLRTKVDQDGRALARFEQLIFDSILS